jgi:hypothetical protein
MSDLPPIASDGHDVPPIEPSTGAATSTAGDTELATVAARLRELDPDGQRTGRVIRDTFDQLYDGQRTGRYRVEQLHKTEKTHFGTLVEINLHREFNFSDGRQMDYLIDGIEVDCKFSLKQYGWMFPPESHGHLCLVVSANDFDSTWSMGLIRVRPELFTGRNRDGKSSLKSADHGEVTWLHRDRELPPNVLLRASADDLQAIFKPKHGTKRVDELFRRLQRQRIGRAVVATVAQQDDFMKRVRDNGGAREHLKPEGIIILGQYIEHQQIARQLQLPIPHQGESVSVRVVRANSVDELTALIEGDRWKIATSTDPIELAPKLLNPSTGSKKAKEAGYVVERL